MMPADLHAVFAGEIESLWTFLSEQGVDPTDNHAERMLRFAVLWRKSSQGAPRVKKAIAGWSVSSHLGRPAGFRKRQPSPSLLKPCAHTSGARNPTSPRSPSLPFDSDPDIAYL